MFFNGVIFLVLSWIPGTNFSQPSMWHFHRELWQFLEPHWNIFSCKITFYCFFITFYPNKRLMILLLWLIFFSTTPLLIYHSVLTYSGCYCRSNRAKTKLFCVCCNTLSMPMSSRVMALLCIKYLLEYTVYWEWSIFRLLVILL